MNRGLRAIMFAGAAALTVGTTRAEPSVVASGAYPEGLLWQAGRLFFTQMGADRVIAVHLAAHWVSGKGPRHVFDVIGQCFSIAQDRMSALWKQHADVMIEPNIEHFGYDEFQRSSEMIAIGEAAAREALPQIRAWLAGTDAELEPALQPLNSQPAEPSAKVPGGAPALHPAPLTAK